MTNPSTKGESKSEGGFPAFKLTYRPDGTVVYVGGGGRRQGVSETKCKPCKGTGEPLIMSTQIEKAFTFHEPKYPGQTLCYNQIRDFAKNFAYVIESACPNSREKSIAMTKLEECAMWANAAIARNEE